MDRPRETLRLRLVDKGVVLEVEEVERVRRESKVVRKVLRGRGGEVAVEGKVEVESFREVVEMMLEDEDEAAAMRRLARGGVARAIGALEVSSLPPGCWFHRKFYSLVVEYGCFVHEFPHLRKDCKFYCGVNLV